MRERRQNGDDLTGRRGGYAELKKELHHFFVRIFIVVAIIGATSIVGLLGYGFAIREVQNQRFSACDDQNQRHDNAIAALKTGSDEDIANAPTQTMKDEIARRRDVTIGLIDAVAPKQDCNTVVETGIDVYLP